MADFRQALAVVLKHEGGFVDHPDDPGGATNFGVSLSFALALGDVNGDGFADLDIDLDGDVDADDIRYMEAHHAADVYRREFWEPLKCDAIRDDAIARKLFDTAVNCGKRQAVKFLQRALYAAHEDLVDDGVIGPKTLAAVNFNALRNHGVLFAMRSEQAGFYRALIMRNAALLESGVTRFPDGRKVVNFKNFERGWLRRAYS
jgi:lysozyme family protein